MKQGTVHFENVKNLKEYLLHVHEKSSIELKKASELPKSFWETYSSFSNTHGGMIILGVDEKYPNNEILGVGNVEKTLTNLWNQLSNPSKVSYRNIENEDVRVVELDGKPVIFIFVKEADRHQKPIYLENRIENAYIRTGDGDQKVTKEELALFQMNASPISADMLPAELFTMNDLDELSISMYKGIVAGRYPKKKYEVMSHEQFLLEIGALIKDRISKEIKVRRGTVLFLGKYQSIKELYPRFHLDYFNRRGNNQRWTDRVAADEPGDYEMNIFNFYWIVRDKLYALLYDSFALDTNGIRLGPKDYEDTVREALANCLGHANYQQDFPSLKVEAYDGWMHFLNPGNMLVSKEQFVIGGDSRPRNECIMKLFRIIGASERQGLGGPMIFKSALEYKFRKPEIESSLQRTELRIWNIDLAESYPDMSKDEKNVLRYILKNIEACSSLEIQKALGLSKYQTRDVILADLIARNLVEKVGKGPATKYQISRDSGEMITALQVLMDRLKKK